MTRMRPRRLELALLLLGLGGCFSVDSGLIPERDAANDPGDDGSVPNAEAGKETIDTSETEPWDSPDAMVEPEVAACSADATCGGEEYCSRATQRCTPRCDQAHGCAIPNFDKPVKQLSSFEGNLVILTAATPDSLGNPGKNQEILLWNRVDPPLKLASGVCRVLVRVTAGQIYCKGDYPGNKLLRIPRATPEAVQEFTSEVETTWHTPSHVWWSVRHRPGGPNSGESFVELWRIGLGEADVPEQVEGPAHHGWLTGNEQRAFFAEEAAGSTKGQVFVRDLALGSDAEIAGLKYVIQAAGSVGAAVDDQALYVTTNYDNVTVRRWPLDGGSARNVSSLPACAGTFRLSGDYLYWECNQEPVGGGPDVFRVGRNGTAAGSEPQVFAAIPSESNARGALAVFPHSVIYYFSLERRLFEVSF